MHLEDSVYLQQLFLLGEAQYLRAHDAGTGLEGEHRSNEWLRLTLTLHHRCYLNHRIFVWFWENS